jgi:hypothetical protein
MDEEKRKLERQVAADPSDERAAARLALMQIRSGMLPTFGVGVESDNMVTTLLRQRVHLDNVDDVSGILVSGAGIIVAVYVPTVASRQATTANMSPIIGALRLVIQMDDDKDLVDIWAHDCQFPELEG